MTPASGYHKNCRRFFPHSHHPRWWAKIDPPIHFSQQGFQQFQGFFPCKVSAFGCKSYWTKTDGKTMILRSCCCLPGLGTWDPHGKIPSNLGTKQLPDPHSGRRWLGKIQKPPGTSLHFRSRRWFFSMKKNKAETFHTATNPPAWFWLMEFGKEKETYVAFATIWYYMISCDTIWLWYSYSAKGSWNKPQNTCFFLLNL